MNFAHHVKIGKEFGVTDADIAALMAQTEGRPSALEPLAKTILTGAREMVRGLQCRTPASPRSKRNAPTSPSPISCSLSPSTATVVRVLVTMRIDNEPCYSNVL